VRHRRSFFFSNRERRSRCKNPRARTVRRKSTHGKLLLRPAELSIWTGINGHGKSQMLGQVLLGAMEQGARVCIASLEIKPKRLLYRLVRQATGTAVPSREYIRQVHHWLDGRLWLFDVTGSAKGERIIEVFRYARKRYGITHFVIDSLMKTGIAEDDYREQKAFVENLCDFKNEFDCHVHLVAHARKGEDESRAPNKLDVKGTGAITDLADNVFSVWRNKRKEAGKADADAPDGVLYCDKSRNGEWEGLVHPWFDKESFQYFGRSDQRPRPYAPFEEPQDEGKVDF
jgi:twinkle protein